MSPDADHDNYDVLVVGAGPSGAACAYWLAERGRRVVMVDKSTFPRDKTCGDGLTPRAVRQLNDMGLADRLADHQRFDGLRAIGHGMTLEMPWPDHPQFPSYGYVVRRRDLDDMVAQRAVKAGATLSAATEAIAPLVEGGVVRGAHVRAKHDGTTRDAPRPVPGGGRWRQQPVRAHARHGARSHLPAGHGHPRLLPQPVPRRAVDREPSRHPRPRRQSPARLRLGVPGGRRDRERRLRAALDLPGLEGHQHHASHGCLRRPPRRPAGASAPTRPPARPQAVGSRRAVR